MLRVIILSISSIFLASGCGGSDESTTPKEESTPTPVVTTPTPVVTIPPVQEVTNSDAVIKDAFLNGISDLQVDGKGVVIKLLADDLEGSKHQKFIIKLNSQQTLLVSHNIDLAPRVDSIKVGDSIEFYGEYEWNDQGGVIHWTHLDPSGNHIDGWLKHNDTIYQ
ncbi:MAG: DUF3465 domain-containing protein [Alteromonadales bacterium]|nr:DUF3465 domain-containing protein [Alteromonadales bacterium]